MTKTNNPQDHLVSHRAGLPVTLTTHIAQELAGWGWTLCRVDDLELWANAPGGLPLSVFVEYPSPGEGHIGVLWCEPGHRMTRARETVAQAARGYFGPSRPPSRSGRVAWEQDWPCSLIVFEATVHPGWLADLIASMTEPDQERQP
ncbi:hypothetical protein [Kocuria sp. CPCC 204721]|uniref:hypothetical protein n=1 Tax=Kocuria sp. CPCC 204721 TaxID=3073548 RepID=UPI0034D6726C